MIGVQVVAESSQTGSFSVFHRMTIFVLMKKRSKKMLEKNLENTNKSFGHYRHQPINIDIVIDKLSRFFYKSTIIKIFPFHIQKKTRTLSYKLFWHKRNNARSNPAKQSGLQGPVTFRPIRLIEFEVLSTRNCDSMSSVMLQIRQFS